MATRPCLLRKHGLFPNLPIVFKAVEGLGVPILQIGVLFLISLRLTSPFYRLSEVFFRSGNARRFYRLLGAETD